MSKKNNWTEENIPDQKGKIVVVNFWSAECPWAKRFDDSVSAMLGKWGEEALWN